MCGYYIGLFGWFVGLVFWFRSMVYVVDVNVVGRLGWCGIVVGNGWWNWMDWW